MASDRRNSDDVTSSGRACKERPVPLDRKPSPVSNFAGPSCSAAAVVDVCDRYEMIVYELELGGEERE